MEICILFDCISSCQYKKNWSAILINFHRSEVVPKAQSWMVPELKISLEIHALTHLPSPRDLSGFFYLNVFRDSRKSA